LPFLLEIYAAMKKMESFAMVEKFLLRYQDDHNLTR
jgi:hypothetical protein